MIARGNVACVQPALDRAWPLANGHRQGGQAAKQNDDTQGGRVAPILALPEDSLHTLTYANYVSEVNVECERRFADDGGMTTNRTSVGTDLRKLYARSGLSMGDLATLMGYKGPSSIQRYLEPSYLEQGLLPLRLASKFSSALTGRGSPPITSQEVFALAGIELTSGGAARPLSSFDLPTATFASDAVQSNVLPMMRRSLDRDLPIFGTALGADLETVSVDGHDIAVEQSSLDTSEAIDFVQRPFSMMENRNAYAVIVSGNSMFPRYDDGEIAVADPSWPARPGDDVIVQLRSPDGDGENERVTLVMIKRLVRRSGSWIELEQFNPPVRFRIDTAQLKATHRILRLGDVVSR